MYENNDKFSFSDGICHGNKGQMIEIFSLAELPRIARLVVCKPTCTTLAHKIIDYRARNISQFCLKIILCWFQKTELKQ